MLFMVTFGQVHPLRDNWVEIEASTYERARELVFSTFGVKWSFIYHEENFNARYFPRGKVGRTLE